MMTGIWYVEEAPMADVVVISGHPRPGSSTSRLAAELGEDVVDFGLTATTPELADPAALADQYTAALIA